jgi:hypothetical protein
MPSKDDLHKLVDSLPDGAIENVHRMLEHFQTWPPQPPPGFPVGRGGFAGSGGGGGMWRRTPDGKLANGRFHRAHFTPDGTVHDTLHVFDGRQLEIQERLRRSSDQPVITYSIRALLGKQELKEEFTFSVADLPEVAPPEDSSLE